MIKEIKTQRTTIVTAGIVTRDGKLLVAQRRGDSDLAYKWEFPGGKLEADESPEHCIERELREELGITVRAVNIYHALTHRYGDTRVLLLCYVCELVDGEPRPIECEAVKWVTFPELLREAEGGRLAEADLALVERMKAKRPPPG
ncbi:MAG: (deoxy)nucleoside triphosphate pyrophosphohydrolase [Ignavibacteriales bacterium]